jgi:1,4-dihydroxy-2-naphthoyl-CoA synthase
VRRELLQLTDRELADIGITRSDVERIASEEAWGLVDEVVKSPDLRPQVQRYAEDLASRPAAALAAIRRKITLGGGMSFENGKAFELETATALADTADFAESVDAFRNKRAPQWAPKWLCELFLTTSGLGH